MATFGTFTSAVLTAAELNTAGGAWTTYTPTYTGFTLGNGTVNYAKYEQVGRTVTVRLKITFGSTTSVTATQPTFSLPATGAITSGDISGIGIVYDSSAGAQYAAIPAFPSTTTITPYICTASATYLTMGAMTTTTPVVMATGDAFLLWFSYEAAADGT